MYYGQPYIGIFMESRLTPYIEVTGIGRLRQELDDLLLKEKNEYEIRFNLGVGNSQAVIRADTRQQPLQFFIFNLSGEVAQATIQPIRDVIVDFLREKCGLENQYPNTPESRANIYKTFCSDVGFEKILAANLGFFKYGARFTPDHRRYTLEEASREITNYRRNKPAMTVDELMSPKTRRGQQSSGG